MWHQQKGQTERSSIESIVLYVYCGLKIMWLSVLYKKFYALKSCLSTFCIIHDAKGNFHCKGLFKLSCSLLHQYSCMYNLLLILLKGDTAHLVLVMDYVDDIHRIAPVTATAEHIFTLGSCCNKELLYTRTLNTWHTHTFQHTSPCGFTSLSRIATKMYKMINTHKQNQDCTVCRTIVKCLALRCSAINK